MKLLFTTPESPCRTAPSPAATTAAADLVLDGVRHQTWEGWGGCFNELGSDALALLSETDRASILYLRRATPRCAGKFFSPMQSRVRVSRV